MVSVDSVGLVQYQLEQREILQYILYNSTIILYSKKTDNYCILVNHYCNIFVNLGNNGDLITNPPPRLRT